MKLDMNMAARLNAHLTPITLDASVGGRPARPSPLLDTLGLPHISDLDPLKAVVLEYQHGMYRVFHVASAGLLVSHECKTEAIRRAERQGLQFGVR